MEELFPGFEECAIRIRPYLARLKFLQEAERDACEKVVAFQGISEAVVRQEWDRLGRVQRLKHRLLRRFWEGA